MGFRAATILSCLTLAGQAHAGAPEDLDRAAQMILNFDYPGAIDLLEHVAVAAEATPAARVRALEMLAVAHFTLGRRQNAVEAARRMYACDPGHQLGARQYPPPVMEFFLALGRSEAARPAALELDVSELPRLRARVEDSRACIERVVVHHRAAGASSFGSSALRRQATSWGGTLSGLADRIDLWAEAVAPSGARLAAFRSEEQPLAIEIPHAPLAAIGVRSQAAGSLGGGPVDRSPGRGWFWATATAGVLTLAAGAVGWAEALSADARAHAFVLGPDGTLAERQRIAAEARSWALAGDVAFGAGLALAVAAALIYWLDPRPARPERAAGPAGFRF